MGDRALIIVTDGADVSPVIYLHWHGSAVPEILARLKDRMTSRGPDVNYAAARLIQEATEGDDGNLSFGVWNAAPAIIKAVIDKDHKTLAVESHGDAGLIVLDVNDYTWQAFGGYLETSRSF